MQLSLKLLPGLEKKRFDMSLINTIKQKLAKEILYDYEIAEEFDLSKTEVERLRKIHGTKKANCFKRKFEEKYGAGALEIFRHLVENPGNTLADMGRYFGFSREYARQIYRKIYGFAYTEVYRQKIEVKKIQRLNQLPAKRKDKKEPLSVIKVREKVEELGFSFAYRNNGNPFNALINGYKVNIKAAYLPVQAGRGKNFSISKNSQKREGCDFFICVCQDKEKRTFYLIPYKFMPRNGASLPVADLQPTSNRRIMVKNNFRARDSKYLKFKESWHLLAKEKEQKAANL